MKSHRISIFLGKFQERVEKESCLWEFKKKNLLPGTTTTCWSAHGCTWPKRYHYSNRTGMKTKVARIYRVFDQKCPLAALYTASEGKVLCCFDLALTERNVQVKFDLNFEVISAVYTPARTLSISGLKSRVLKLPFFNLRMMVNNGPDCCCPVQKKSAQEGWIGLTG